jgi:hypothetical protein
MAADTVLLTRKRVFSAAIESTTASAATLNAAAGIFNAFAVKYTSEIPPVEREGQGSFTMLPPVAGPRWGTLEFETEVYNAATPPLWLSTLLVACGCTVSSSTYTPSSSVYNTASIGIYQDGGRLRTLVGAVGNAVFTGEVGKPMRAKWKFEGVWIAPSTVSQITPTYPTTIPPRFASGAITIGGASYRFGKLEFDLGNTIAKREDEGHVSGYRAAIVTSRKPTLKVSPEAQRLDTGKDWTADYLASTSATLSAVIGTGTNGVITIGSTLYHQAPPQDEDRDGIHLDSLDFTCASGTSDGEWSIVAS